MHPHSPDAPSPLPSALCPPRPNTTPCFATFDASFPPLENSPSPFISQAWESRLSLYPGKLPTHIVGILTYGCQVGYSGPFAFILSKNLMSSKLDPKVITSQLHDDLLRGRVVQVLPVSPFISSPLGLVPKHDGGFRRIQLLSFPTGNSVNDFIPREASNLVYLKLEEVFQMVLAAGHGCVIMKRDIKDAFRNIPVAPQWRWLLGFHWGNNYYTETCLPFGLATAPFIFNLFAEAFHWTVLTHLRWRFFCHYLDDFVAIFSAAVATSSFMASRRQEYIALTDELGIPRKDSKDWEGTTAEVLGIEVDTILREARLSPAKLTKAITAVNAVLLQESLSLRDAQVLAGYLSFCAKVVRLGRMFLSEMWTFIASFRLSDHPLSIRRIPATLRLDLQLWSSLLPEFNGVLFFDDPTRTEHHLYGDASSIGLSGFHFTTDSPAVLRNPPPSLPSSPAPLEVLSEASPTFLEGLQSNPMCSPPSWVTAAPRLPIANSYASRVAKNSRNATGKRTPDHINVLELRAILFSFERWAHIWKSQRVVVFTDNSAAFYGLRKGSIRGPPMAPLRKILLLASKFDILFRPSWISTDKNTLADALSRFDGKAIANLCPHWQTPYHSPPFQPPLQTPSEPIPSKKQSSSGLA